jgi:hypothetical protein
MDSNPFTDCVVKKNAQDQWCVSSVFWTVPCASEKDAERVCGIIQNAYRHGASDLRDQFNVLLGNT